MLIFIFVLFGGFSYGFVLRASLWFCLECFPLGMANGHALKSPMHIAAHIRSYMHEYICIIRIILHFPHPHGHPYSPHFVWRASLQLVHHSIREVVTQRILEVINFWHFDWPIHYALWCLYDNHHTTDYNLGGNYNLGGDKLLALWLADLLCFMMLVSWSSYNRL